ncbi:hypothetical protein ACQKOE_08480 [Novosphingobium sp. NPDC080210]|jgi:hypothetical protein|uniref:hypothetical protein n=1 Tax=unclassified Novosphingobium TaxID=2644732 RepID=UPI00323475DC
MNLTRDRMRSIGWAAVLLVCLTFTVVLTFKVNAVKSQVRLAERQILAVKQDKLLLETEFQTRANQQQLRALNEVEFGYQAPAAGQYLEGERQLADLGKPRGPDAPSPIRVANADVPQEASMLTAMVSPLTGKAMAAEPAAAKRKATTDATLSARLGTLDRQGVRHE